MSEASEIIRITPAEGLDLQEKAKAGSPAVVRRFTLYSAWRAIQADRFIPTQKKQKVFETLCRTVEIEIVDGDDPTAIMDAMTPDDPLIVGAIRG